MSLSPMLFGFGSIARVSKASAAKDLAGQIVSLRDRDGRSISRFDSALGIEVSLAPSYTRMCRELISKKRGYGVQVLEASRIDSSLDWFQQSRASRAVNLGLRRLKAQGNTLCSGSKSPAVSLVAIDPISREVLALVSSASPSSGQDGSVALEEAKPALALLPAACTSFASGKSHVSLLQLTNAYATMAVDGLYMDPVLIRRVDGVRLAELWPGSDRVHRAIEADQAQAVIRILEAKGPRRRSGDSLILDHFPGKGGSSTSGRDAWYFGFSNSLVVGVWIGQTPECGSSFQSTDLVQAAEDVWSAFMASAMIH